MRLTTIKLSGFKSFVDPTTLHLPTNMTGVVGPNGCGKSNIIDAIRWVMGESAASRLRGDSLTDVIFSGSSGRKPVGSAMVELLFDNSDGAILGEYAAYNEISVKRVVSRDGQSQYSLNGTRCRRRDITDLFLGTGLGPRSYSIIEQGMISEVVEADPEQLRGHLEEAAGVSRYKERRRETESRIKATRENLDRVRDVRDEVDKQLEHLKRQARTAERWQALKDEQRRKDAESKALQWRAANAELEAHSSVLGAAQTAIEQQLAEQRACESAIELGRDAHLRAGEAMNAVQAGVYRVGADIARVEQQIRHTRELAEQLDRARGEAERAHAELGAHIDDDARRLGEIAALLASAAPELEQMKTADNAARATLLGAEAALAEWQTTWNVHAQAAAEVSQATEVERTRLDYLDKQALHAEQRIATLTAERDNVDLDALLHALTAIDQAHAELQGAVAEHSQTLDARKGDAEAALAAERDVQAALSEQRGDLENLRGRLGSLEALQQAALGDRGGKLDAWLASNGLGSLRRLGEVLQVEAGWERAVEVVLEGWIEAAVVDAAIPLRADLGALGDIDATLIAGPIEARLAVVSNEAPASPMTATLAAKAAGPALVKRLLACVHPVESIAAAHALLAECAGDASCVTRDGEWFGRDFARVRRGGGAQIGVIAREREIRELALSLGEIEAALTALATRLEHTRAARGDAERHRDGAQGELHATHRRLAEVAGQLQSHRGRVDASRERLQRVTTELDGIAGNADADREQTHAARARLETAITQMGEHEQTRRRLDAQRRELLEAREESRMNAQAARDAVHELALATESRRAAAVSLEQALARMRDQHAELAARREQIAAQIGVGSEPIEALEAERQAHLSQRLLVDRQMVEARQRLQAAEAQVRELEQRRHRFEADLREAHEQVSTLKLAAQEHRLRARALTDAISDGGFDLQALLDTLAGDADAHVWGQALADLEQKIRRLEPVNLAAIQEHEEHAQRKAYLDAQLADLGTALETLEGAIRKIDKETRARFKETFDRVNSGVQELFPRLFGGGHAHLQLTGDDLLSTGVTIMARPPGKRVSSISLLSGGEKALTAVSLVFAIFRLNPAPFCLLDEVDAPLDEANVGRFSALVAEMSEHVQFIFVTHNKGTMEAARQLCGVTMREPGVSRLVQVDLAEAAKLAGAA